jgi:hypothetical protein
MPWQAPCESSVRMMNVITEFKFLIDYRMPRSATSFVVGNLVFPNLKVKSVFTFTRLMPVMPPFVKDIGICHVADKGVFHRVSVANQVY